jgi:hypothetical protein
LTLQWTIPVRSFISFIAGPLLAMLQRLTRNRMIVMLKVRPLLLLSLMVLGSLSGCYFKHDDWLCESCPVGRLDITCYTSELPHPVAEETLIFEKRK